MDHRTILATGFLLLCGAVFVQSLKSANAFPQGPNVSTGSNPIESFYGQGRSLTFQQNFIVTTLLSSSTSCSPTIDGTYLFPSGSTHNPFYYQWNASGGSSFLSGNAHLKITGGSILDLTSCNDIYVDGYYTH